MKYSMHSCPAQFCEARVNETTGELRISRFLGSFDAGRILNPKTAVSQFRGGIIMGLGMALTEETMFDDRTGHRHRRSAHRFGAHGIGEIGITGVAAAVANAVYHATGKRVTCRPITLDKLLSSAPGH